MDNFMMNTIILAASACALAGIYVANTVVSNNQSQRVNKRIYRKKRFWVRPIYKRRKEQGDYHNLMMEMRLHDTEMFFHFTRMSVSQFDSLLSIVGPLLIKKSNREPLAPGQRLAITIRYLATGCSQQTLGFAFRVGKTTVCHILKETCSVLWEALHKQVFMKPSKKNWMEIAQKFQKKWNFPHCIGALDGKHVRIQAPPNTGSVYFNYKHYFSVVLLALCDESYKFILVDIGGVGSESDGGLFARSKLGQMFETNEIFVPEPSAIDNSAKLFPYVMVADEAFPLKHYIMRPYPGKKLTDTQRIFNYRLSRARRIIENSFGILVARWRVFHSPINAKVENVDNIIGATVCLHNFLMMFQEKMQGREQLYCPSKYVDHEINGVEKLGEWRQDVIATDMLLSVKRVGSNNAQKKIFEIREDFSKYFITPEGALPWQHNCLEKGFNKNLPVV